MAQPQHDNNVLPFENPSASVVLVTPEIAARWLQRNTSNRNIRPRKVEQYARDMEAGDWQITGEAVKFSKDGLLIDGQHRLEAVVLSQVSVSMFVVRGLDNSAQAVMDSGAARTSGDNLGLMGFKNANTCSSTARLILCSRLGGDSWRYDATHAEVYSLIQDNPDIQVAADIATKYARATDVVPRVIAYTSWLIGNTHGYDYAEKFWNAAATKVGLQAGDPVIALTTAFSELRRQRRNLDVRAQISAVIRMYNAWRVGKPVKQLKFVSPGGPNAFVAIPAIHQIA